MEQDINFIARRFRQGLFDVEPALNRIIPQRPSLWRRIRVAAAIGGFVVISATAALIIRHNYFPDRTPAVEQPSRSPMTSDVIHPMDFEDTPLPLVVEEINAVYGVEVTNLPDHPESYTLSLHYEGTASDLVETINDILDTHMTILER